MKELPVKELIILKKEFTLKPGLTADYYKTFTLGEDRTRIAFLLHPFQVIAYAMQLMDEGFIISEKSINSIWKDSFTDRFSKGFDSFFLKKRCPYTWGPNVLDWQAGFQFGEQYEKWERRFLRKGRGMKGKR
jgi:hypothetical protein